MSADKKAPGGRSEAERTSLSRSGGAQAHGSETSESAKKAESAIDNNAKNSDGHPQRPRAQNQDMLPGILGKQLRAAYGELLNAPLPDQFTELIKRLEGKEGGSSRKASGEENEQ